MKFLAGLFYLVSTSMAPVPRSFTERHHCVPKAEVSCVVDLPFLCPPGYLDGCISGDESTHRCVLQEEGPGCDLQLSLHCPQHFIDGCITRETPVHSCVPIRGGRCTQGKEFSCPSGFEDSCAR